MAVCAPLLLIVLATAALLLRLLPAAAAGDDDSTGPLNPHVVFVLGDGARRTVFTKHSNMLTTVAAAAAAAADYRCGAADVGFGDVGYVDPAVISPAIDSLALSGVRFGRAYSYCWCAPSRSALMTGRLPPNNGVYSGASGAYFALSAQYRLLPQMLAEAGYISHAVGKVRLVPVPAHDRY